MSSLCLSTAMQSHFELLKKAHSYWGHRNYSVIMHKESAQLYRSKNDKLHEHYICIVVLKVKMHKKAQRSVYPAQCSRYFIHVQLHKVYECKSARVSAINTSAQCLCIPVCHFLSWVHELQRDKAAFLQGMHQKQSVEMLKLLRTLSF